MKKYASSIKAIYSKMRSINNATSKTEMWVSCYIISEIALHKLKILSDAVDDNVPD